MILIFAIVFFTLVFTACNEDCERCNDIVPPNVYHAVSYLALDGGSISGAAEQTIRHGQSATAVIAIADYGFEFVGWNDGVETPARHDTNIITRITVVAEFEKIITPPYTYHVVLYIALTGGTIQGYAEQTVRHGQNATAVTAVADYGFEFARWNDGVETPARQDTNITGRITVVAEFIEIIIPYVYHAVTYLALNGGSIYGLVEQTITNGQNAYPVKAVADIGFVFVRWSDDIDTPARHDTNVTARITVIAIFDYAVFEVNYLAGYGGEIWGEYFQLVQWGHFSNGVVAVPNTGFIFIGWCDGVEYEIRDDIIKDNFTATAHFERIFYGEGTPYKPFKIFDHQDLMNMRLFPANFFKMQNDIDLIGINHEPIFDTDNSFWGGFDGGGFTIYNMYVNVYHAFPSLFGLVHGKIHDLNMVDFEIVVPNKQSVFVGAVAGDTAGKMLNINVSGKIHSDGHSHSFVAIGGMVGRSHNAIINCHADIIIELINIAGSSRWEDFFVGGLVGWSSGFLGFSRNDIHFSSAKGQIEIEFLTVWDNALVGGLIGLFEWNRGQEIEFEEYTVGLSSQNEEKFIKWNIYRCVAMVEITGAALNGVGGLIGMARTSSLPINIGYSSATGNIRLREGGSAGGFINTLFAFGGVIQNSFATGNVFARFAGGFAAHLNSISGVLGCEHLLFINYSYATGNVEGNSASGFVNNADFVNFFRTFSSGEVRGVFAAGFAFMIFGGRWDGSSFVIDNKIEESFSTGDVIGVLTSTQAELAGFIFHNISQVINSFSTSDLHMTPTTFSASGFIQTNHNTFDPMINSFHAGMIYGYIGQGGIISAIGMILPTVFDNFHWLRTQNLIPIWSTDYIAYYNYIYVYESIEDMFFLADTLNTDNKQVWVNRENNVPMLKFAIGLI